MKTGTLYLCATPIGNLEDITFRVVRVLGEADLIAAEDTRSSLRLLRHYDIRTPMTSYHEHNKIEKAKVLIEKLKDGTNIALITDAGTPGISDPGEELVRMCREEGIEVTSLPGPAAAVTALTASGLPTGRFAFEAFLPKDRKKRKRILSELKNETRTIVLYESPHHLKATLGELSEVLGSEREIALCRELTKIHETFVQTTFAGALKLLEEEEARGEYVIVIKGREFRQIEQEEQKEWEALTIPEHVALYEQQGLSRKDAMKQAAADRGLTKRDIYQTLIEKNM